MSCVKSGQRGEVHICEPGGRRTNVFWTFCSSWDRGQKGDGDSECGIAGTVVIGDRDSGGVYS